MRKTFLIVLTLVLSVSAQMTTAAEKSSSAVATEQTTQAKNRSHKYWQKMADGMSQALIDHFWGANFYGFEKRYYFNYGSNLSNLTTNHYWPQAHAMDVIVDAYMRSGKKQYLDIYPLWWEGAPKFNFSGRKEDPWWNVFVDDMEWIVLAQIRMWESTGDTKYIEKARQMYDQWVWTTWGPEDEAPWYGGITWKTVSRNMMVSCLAQTEDGSIYVGTGDGRSAHKNNGL